MGEWSRRAAACVPELLLILGLMASSVGCRRHADTGSFLVVREARLDGLRMAVSQARLGDAEARVHLWVKPTSGVVTLYELSPGEAPAWSDAVFACRDGAIEVLRENGFGVLQLRCRYEVRGDRVLTASGRELLGRRCASWMWPPAVMDVDDVSRRKTADPVLSRMVRDADARIRW